MLPLLLLSACTHDDDPASPAGAPLPPHAYPLQIASVTISADGQPLTRLADEGNSTKWQEGDQIGVRIGDDPETGIYKMDVDVQGSLVGITPIKPVYWKNTAPATITAWYPVTDEIDFTHQDKGLTYLLKAEPVKATYNQSDPINLTFTHQLAKVRVLLEGKKAQDVTAVYVRSYPKSANNQGALGNSIDDPIYVPMLGTTYEGKDCWEATLRDGHLEADNTFEVANAKGRRMRVMLAQEDMPIAAGQVYTINISVNEPKQVEGNISDSDTYIVSGERNEPINITGGSPTIYLDEANITANSGNTINITGGNPTIYIVGQNTITSSSGTGIYVAKGCSVTIISDDRVSNALTVTGKITGIGGSANEDEVLDCGDITIRNVTLSASTDSESIYVSYGSVHRPGIGAVGTAACGTITIDNSTVTAYGSGDYSNRSAAAIGGGLVGTSIGEKISISISNSDIYAHRNCSVGNYIGQGGHFQSAQKGQIDADVKNSTIHKYTSDTYDGQTVYGDDGTVIE